MSSRDLRVQQAVNEAVLHPPAMRIDVAGVITGGRKRARRRYITQAGMSGLAVLVAVTTWFGLGNGADVMGLQIDPARPPTFDTSVAINQDIRPQDDFTEEGISEAAISREPGDDHFQISSTVDGVRKTFDPVEADLPAGVDLFAIGDVFLVVVPTFDGVIADPVWEKGSWYGWSGWDLDTPGGSLAFVVVEPNPGRAFQTSDIHDVVWMTRSTWWGREAQVIAASGRPVDRATLSVGSEELDVFVLSGLNVWGELDEYSSLDSEIDPGAPYLTASGIEEDLVRWVSFVPQGSTDIRVDTEEDTETNVAVATAPVGDWIAVLRVMPGDAGDLRWTSPDGVDFSGTEPVGE